MDVPTLYVTVGIPASGKSTWARSFVERNPNEAVIVCKDDLRPMLHGDVPWSKAQEAVTNAMRNAMIKAALMNGMHVVCADTNIPNHVRRDLKRIADLFGADYEEIWFAVPVEECIRRNGFRERHVPEEVIRRMSRDLDKATPIS